MKRLRQEKNLSQERLALKCKLHRTYISDVERAARNVSIRNVEKIAKALGVEVEEMVR